jgi:hypothetical protein
MSAIRPRHTLSHVGQNAGLQEDGAQEKTRTTDNEIKDHIYLTFFNWIDYEM